MKIADLLTKTTEFLNRKVAEFFGLCIILLSLSLFTSLVTYSPSDPNFLADDINEIKNVLGLKGSIVSDFFFQSMGLVSYLIPITLFFSGLNIFINKKYIIFIDNIFYTILYVTSGSLFLSFFKNESFFLTVNGNGGFIGSIIKGSYFGNILEINLNISYYSLALLTILLFLISIDFRLSKLINNFKFLKKLFRFKTKEEIDIVDTVITEKISSESKYEKTRIQDSLPFESKSDINNKL